MVLSHNTCHELLSLVKICSQHALAAKEHQSRHSHSKVVAIFPARTCRDVLKNMHTKDFCPSYLVRNSCLVLLGKIWVGRTDWQKLCAGSLYKIPMRDLLARCKISVRAL